MKPPTDRDGEIARSIRGYFDELAADTARATSPAPPRRHRLVVVVAVAVVVVVATVLVVAGRTPATGPEQLDTATPPAPVVTPPRTAAPGTSGTTPAQAPDTANPLRVQGVVELNDHDPSYESGEVGEPCVAGGRYSMIHSQATLTVSDAAGAPVAATTLGPGQIATGGSAAGRVCEFPFAIGALPLSPTYVFSIEDGPANSYTRPFVEASSHHLTLTVGPCC